MSGIHSCFFRRRRARREALLAFGLIVSWLVSACGEITPQTAFNPRSAYAAEQLDLFVLIIWMGVIVGVLVEAALIWAAIRYRRRPGDRLPPQIHGNTIVEILWTSGPVAIVGAILALTLPIIFASQAPAPQGSMQVEVVGHQFWWEFRYPDQNVITANELHLPVGRTVNLALSTDDVLHSFWVPALGGKRDSIPGHVNHVWLTPDSAGEFPGQCYQLCGYSHGNMRERAFVQPQAEFDQWVAAQQQPAVAPSTPEETEGAQIFQQRGCGGCHTIQGTPNAGRVGPNLTHFASRTTFAGSIFENNPQNVRRWINDPPTLKPGSIMPKLGLNDHELDVVTAYLQSLR